MLESNLVRDLLRHLPAFLSDRSGSEQVELVKEVAAGRSIADVVALVSGDADCGLRSDPLTTRESVLLAAVRRADDGLPIDHLGIAIEDFDRLALRLIERRLLLEQGGILRLHGALSGGFMLIAFEAKLSKWRTAMQQAIEYRRFANESFVVMPAGNQHLVADHQRAFRESGVGLLFVTQRSMTTCIDAHASDEHDWRREYVVSRMRGRVCQQC